MSLTPEQKAEANAFAEQYLGIAFMLADLGPGSTTQDADRVADELERFYGYDPREAAERLWQAAFVGPVLIAGAMRKLHGARPDDDDWALTPPADYDRAADPHTLPAMQAVTAALNNDRGAVRDVIRAHFDSALAAWGVDTAHAALAEVVHRHLNYLADLIVEGAFAT